MGILDKLQTVIILIAVGLGLLLGQVNLIEQHAETLVIPFLFLMLYGLFLTIPLHQLKRAFLNIKFLGANTIINFIWTPVIAWGLGSIFLADYPALWIGFIMLIQIGRASCRERADTSVHDGPMPQHKRLRQE